MENKQQNPEEQAVSQVTGFETFVKKYQKILSGGVIAVLIIVFGCLAANKWIIAPAEQEAQGQMFPAEFLLAQGRYAEALNGDGNILGFAQIIDEFGARAGQAVYLYAGICAYNTGDFEAAAGYFKKYSGKDIIIKGKALCALGDSYANLEKYSDAIAAYKKAAATADNAYRAGYLFKAAQVCEKTGNDGEALAFYKEIKTKYPQTPEGFEAGKYISKIENK